MPLSSGDLVATSRTVSSAWLFRRVRVRTPGVVTAVQPHRSGELRYTVAFEVRGAPGTAVVVKGLRERDLVKKQL